MRNFAKLAAAGALSLAIVSGSAFAATAPAAQPAKTAMTKKRSKKLREPTADEIRRIAEYYDNQTDEEGAAEIENAPLIAGSVWIRVPEPIVPQVRKLIARYKKSV